jgi:hypothetical protein
MSTQTLSQIFQSIPVGTVEWNDDHTTDYSVDPLACAVAMYRNSTSYGLLRAANAITDEDQAQANAIRNYYSKKYFWDSLKAQRPQSEYRQNAVRLLSITKDWKLTDRDAGLFVKLPWFYAEDQIYDEFRSTLKVNRDSYVGPNAFDSVSKKLTYLKKTIRWQGSKRAVSFWFKDDDSKLSAVTVYADNPFNDIFEEQIQVPRVFEFTPKVDRLVDMWYNTIKSFKIIKEPNA